MSKIFVSYSHEDTNTADEIVAILDEFGVEYFRDTKDIEWGGSISSEVKLGIEEALAVLVIVSPASLKSHWVPYEIGYGTALGKKILPHLVHPSLDVPHYIKDLSYTTRLEQIRERLNAALLASAKASAEIQTATILPHQALNKLKVKLPKLLAEMKTDLKQDVTGFVREFAILPNRRVRFNSGKPRFHYFEDEHPSLRNQVDLLERQGLVTDVTPGNTPIYAMTEVLVDWLLITEFDTPETETNTNDGRGQAKRNVDRFDHEADTVLSDDAMELLIEAVQEPSGAVACYGTLDFGQHVQANNREFVDPRNPRSEARWLGAVEELVDLGFWTSPRFACAQRSA